jgi:hypothetical protein
VDEDLFVVLLLLLFVEVVFVVVLVDFSLDLLVDEEDGFFPDSLPLCFAVGFLILADDRADETEEDDEDEGEEDVCPSTCRLSFSEGKGSVLLLSLSPSAQGPTRNEQTNRKEQKKR